MKRRDFLTTVGLGAFAAGSVPVKVFANSNKKSKLSYNATSVAGSEKPPLTESYSTTSRARSGIALGGIGAGSVELRKNGQFYNWSIFNNYPRGTGPVFKIPQWPRDGWEESLQFFLVRYQEKGKDAKIKLLQINDSINEGGLESIDYYYPWMSAVQHIEYAGRFPFVTMRFWDDEMPFEIEMQAFSPFIPHDAKNSSLPGVYFDFKIISKTNTPVDVMLIGSQRNLVGYDTFEKYFITDLVEKENYKFFTQTAGRMDKSKSTYGQMGFASLSPDTSYYLGWEHKHPYYERLLEEKQFPDINDTDGRNLTDEETGKKIGRTAHRLRDQRCFSSIATSKKLNKKGESCTHSFVMSWYFPNAYGSHNHPDGSEQELIEKGYTANQKITKNQGNYYNNFFNSAYEVADYMVKHKVDLTRRSKQFVDDFYASDVEQFVLDQINSNLNTFITSSTFTKAGNFAIREGMTPDKSWGPNATIDVSLYGSIPVLHLFPELQKSTLRCHRDLQSPEGEINHGLGYDLNFTQNGTWGVFHRIDMPPNYIQLVLRDYFWTNDKEYLKEMWPSIKKAVEYVLTKRDKDNNMMPDMNGIMCSYDNFPMYGLASYIQSQWIAAMASAVIAAEQMSDKQAEKQYKKILKKGSKLMDEKLWNGEYYRLSNDYNGEFGNKGKDEGCLTDQIIGQWMAHLSGLGYLFKKEHVKKALRNILKMSFKQDFGLRNCSWPQYPKRFPIHESNLWVDQANTPWTGVELAFASFLLYEDFYKEALSVIQSVDDRYRIAGLYWDHQEFGGHYYRPMSAWAIVSGLLGMSINQNTYSFSPKIPKEKFTMFFAYNKGTAHYISSPQRVEIKVLTGQMQCKAVNLENTSLRAKDVKVKAGDKPIDAKISEKEGKISIQFDAPVQLKQGQSLKFI